MGNINVGPILYFWLFIGGVLIVGKLMGVMQTGKQTILICVLCAVIYIVWNLFRYLGKKKRAEQEWQAQMQAKNKKK